MASTDRRAEVRSEGHYGATARSAREPAGPCATREAPDLNTLWVHAPLLDDRPCLESLVRRAAEATGATVLSLQAHHFEPHGVTVLALLAESHMSLHSYPETGVVFVDCFTCGACDPRRSVPILTAALRPAEVREELIDRAG